MTFEEAEARCRQLNNELADRGLGADAFYIEVEESPGHWTVEKRAAPRSWFGRLLDVFFSAQWK